MSAFNVVGDIAGQYNTLQALLNKMPKDADLISLGDPCDRGPQSKEVIEFLMKTGQTVNSNHAHMMTEAWDFSKNEPQYKIRYYEHGIWISNGGSETIKSYQLNEEDKNKKLSELIPEDHINWLKSCPLYIRSDKFVFTHAPLHSQLSLEEASKLGTGFVMKYDPESSSSLLWNRFVGESPHKFLNGEINIFGHNSSDRVKVYSTKYPHGIKVENQEQFHSILNDRDTFPVYGICLDTSGAKILTGLHLPTMTLYSQEYL